MPENYFERRSRDGIDQSAGQEFEPAAIESTVDFLAGMAQGGAALELGIGTGRIAVPLAERGVAVSGIDLSEAMVANCARSPAARRFPSRSATLRQARIDGTFTLAYLVFNTIMNLTTRRRLRAHERRGASLKQAAASWWK